MACSAVAFNCFGTGFCLKKTAVFIPTVGMTRLFDISFHVFRLKTFSVVDPIFTTGQSDWGSYRYRDL